ncbi:MAG: threonylcarbamoyl-AMP synthase [Nevskiaceae bacterium]|jgi:L-threonylcarbamoyladenylate synthase|nr:threonylcarbamoyl-AMP synthase [Nevskiaceae bacterium]
METAVRVLQTQIQLAVDALRSGQLISFPTETVYGLGADAANASAVRRIFELKGRPSSHPLIVHVAQRGALREWAAKVSPVAEKLAEAFWPGPLTLVLPRAASVLDAVTGGQDSIAIRIPSHPIAQDLLSAFGGGIAAPSANRFGRLSATRAEHVREEFGDAVKVILDGGPCAVGLESTIVSCLDEIPRLLRPGAVTLAQLQAVAGTVRVGGGHDAPRVPGSTVSHYAPSTPLSIVANDELDRLTQSLARSGQRVAVLAQRAPSKVDATVTWINAGTQASAYAHDLYANLRALDHAGCALILVQDVPGDPSWDAIRDRLQRAAAAHPSLPMAVSS